MAAQTQANQITNDKKHALGSGGHGGNLRQLAKRAGRPVSDILDFSANLNPLGSPAWLRMVVNRTLEEAEAYPDPYADEFRQAFADAHRLSADQIVAGNGSSELLYAIPRALDVNRAWVPGPGYIDYARACEAAGVAVDTFFLDESRGFLPDLADLAQKIKPGDLVFFGQPNNPTSSATAPEVLRSFIMQHAETWFVIDEAFADFCPEVSILPTVPANAIVSRSLTKFYAIAGFRLGCIAASVEVASKIRQAIPPWNVNTLAQAVGIRALSDKNYADQTICMTNELRADLCNELGKLDGVTVYPAKANYVLCRFDAPWPVAKEIVDTLLLGDGIAVRACDNYTGLSNRYLRFAVRPAHEQKKLVDALRVIGISCFPASEAAQIPVTVKNAKIQNRRAKTLMLQGTGSNVGKSVLAAAFCRIFLQDGYRVAPFKAQNMALNSFVTRDGGEMGRAQVVQAQACRLDPDVRMNPILLKPSSDVGSQVIVNGHPVGNMRVKEYHAYKPQAAAAARTAFDDLAAEYDIVVLEGAGSPGEVNLKSHDIVNMRMAEYANSPVLLIGDIDRGGVYASLIGTMDVLESWERKLIRGYLVNLFRGDASLLAPAHEYVENYTSRPVVGVIPYLKDLGVPDEDSVSFKSGQKSTRLSTREDALTIALVELPHISNFSDFDPLITEPDVTLKTVRSPEQAKGADIVILPGSKNVLDDYAWLESSGFAKWLTSDACTAEIVGVCGGLQMLGTTVADPHKLESARGQCPALGILPLTTTLELDKVLLQTEGTHKTSGKTVRGYEIHHGRTVATGDVEPILTRNDGEAIGFELTTRPVWGTYLHGIFDADEFRRWWLDRARMRKGLQPLQSVQAHYDIDAALNKLAQIVRENVDMKRIREWMGF